VKSEQRKEWESKNYDMQEDAPKPLVAYRQGERSQHGVVLSIEMQHEASRAARYLHATSSCAGLTPQCLYFMHEPSFHMAADFRTGLGNYKTKAFLDAGKNQNVAFPHQLGRIVPMPENPDAGMRNHGR
jgi:hypothetical protein